MLFEFNVLMIKKERNSKIIFVKSQWKPAYLNSNKGTTGTAGSVFPFITHWPVALGPLWRIYKYCMSRATRSRIVSVFLYDII